MDSSWTAEGDQIGASFGYSVSSAGDVNGDGFADVLIGAYNYDNGETDEGAAFLYLGSPSGLSSTPSWTAESDQAYARMGYSVSSAGDVNGDGYDDVIIGAYVYDNGEADEGRVFLYTGSSSGLSASPSWTAESNLASSYFGSTVTSAGDVNGDGYDEVLITALFYSNGESMEGAAFLYLGSASGLPSSPSWTAEGNQAFAYFGRSASGAGDVNNDGYDDVVVGAYYYDSGQTNEGAAFLYLGSPTGLSSSSSWMGESNVASAGYGYTVSSSGDVNNDGYSDLVVGAVSYSNGQSNEGSAYLYLGSASGLSTSSAWMVESNQANAYMGVASSAGDVNGDGFCDVIVGAYFYDNETQDEGNVSLYIGSSSGLSADPSWIAESDQYYTMFGSTLSGAGDVDGDTYDDIIVGAYSYDAGQTDEGRAYVFYSHLAPPPATFDLVLQAGYNFVTIPLQDHGYSAGTLGLSFGDVVSGWDPSTQTYAQGYIVGLSPPSSDFGLHSSTGYWIFTSTAKTLTLNGNAPAGSQSRTITLPEGGGYANVGLNSHRTTWHASDIATMYSGGELTMVAYYNPLTGTYQAYIPIFPSTDFLLFPGQAYWCWFTASGTLTYSP